MAYDNYLNLAITWCEIDIRRMDAVRDFTVLCEIGFTPDTFFFQTQPRL